MPSPDNTRQTLIRTSLDDDLNSFPAEDSPTGRPDDVPVLPEQHAQYDYALRLFDAEGEPTEGEGLLQSLPAPPPAPAAPAAPVAPAAAPISARPSHRRTMQTSVAAAACVAIAALVTAAWLSRPASEPPVEVRSPQASDEPASLGSLGTLELQSGDVNPMGPPDLQRAAALDRTTTTTAQRRQKAAPGTTVSTASRAQTLRTPPREPQTRGTAGSVAPGTPLRPTPPPVSDVTASARTAEEIPPPAPIAAPSIPAAFIPLVETSPTPAQAATVRPPPAVLAAPSASVVVVNEEAAVRTVLDRYRIAYSGLDVDAARAVLPSVDAKALGRAFERLQSQEIIFDHCQIAVYGTRATAACGGDTRFVPKVGSRTERFESRKWTFDMRKTGDQWTISGVEVR